MKDNGKQINIFLVNYDWRDIYHNDFNELINKLNRDRLNPDQNNFFFYSWSNVSYEVFEGRFQTLHKKTRIYKLKPLLDLLAVVNVVLVARRSKFKPDIWLTYDFGMLPALWVARKLLGGKVVLCVTNEPRVYSRTRRFGFIKGIYSMLCEKIWRFIPDQFFTINKNMSLYLQRLGVDQNKISLFYSDTIDRDLKYIQKAEKGKVRKDLNLEGKKILFSIGRLESEKNYPELLNLFAKLDRDYVLIIAGQGSLFSLLKKQTEDLGISDRVIFAGSVGRDQIWNYFLDADAFVLLSKAEALGLVFWEAMYMGLPVIGSDADGIVETIGKDGERGRIWKKADGLLGFKEKVEFCIQPGRDKEEMILRAKNYVNEQRKNSLTINDII